MITNRYFPLQFMEGFCMKGTHLNKACNVQWKQLLSYFSTSHKSGWGIFLSWSANHTITVWTDLKCGNCYDHQVHYICWCSHRRRMFCSSGSWKQIAWLLCGNMKEAAWPRQTKSPLTDNPAAFATNSGLQFPTGLPRETTSPIQEMVLLQVLLEGFTSQFLHYYYYMETNSIHLKRPSYTLLNMI